MKKKLICYMFALLSYSLSNAETPPAMEAKEADRPREYKISNEKLSVSFDRDTAGISSIIDIKTGLEFISSKERQPLFRISLTKPQEGKREYGYTNSFSEVYLNKHESVVSSSFGNIRFEQSGPDSLNIRFTQYKKYSISATVTVRSEKSGKIRMGISVENNTHWCIATITFPPIVGVPVLGSDPNQDKLLEPWHSGGILTAPGAKTNWAGGEYPGSAFAQFYARYNDTAGLYCAMEDCNGHCKKFKLRTRPGHFVSVELEHKFPEIPGNNVKLPYEVVLTTFHGDWRDGAAIYKQWAQRQPWCAKGKIAKRRDFPSYLQDGAGILIGNVSRNKNDVFEWYGRDGEKLADLLDEYRRRTGLKRIIYIPYGWEKDGTWAGINYLPANPSNEFWQRVNHTIKGRDHRLAFLTSGYWWVVKRRDRDGKLEFDNTADFEKHKGMCVTNPDGSVWEWDSFDDYRGRTPWRGLSVELCHGSKEASHTLKKTFLELAGLGIPLLSFDQEIGGGQHAPCYSTNHGHPPGYGNWMWTGFRDLCRSILAEGRNIEPELGLFLENVSELAIPYMATYWSRQFGEVNGYSPVRCIGLFSYLYHEYVTCIGAACVQGQGVQGKHTDPLLRARILANNLTRGLIPGPFIGEVPLEPETEWEKIVAPAYFAFCKPYKYFPEYVIQGRAVRPPKVQCDSIKTWYYERDYVSHIGKKGNPPLQKSELSIETVTAGSFAAADGSVGTFVVNSTPNPRRAIITLPAKKKVVVYSSERVQERKIDTAGQDQPVQLNLEPFGVRVLIAD